MHVCFCSFQVEYGVGCACWVGCKSLLLFLILDFE